MIQERVKAGLARAKSQGKRLGRPEVSDAIKPRILRLRAKAKGMISIAMEVGAGVGTVQRIVKAA